MDPIKSVDDVAFTVRGHRIHAFDVLEAQVLSYESPVPKRFHSTGSILDIRDRIFLRVQNRARGSYSYGWHIHRTDSLRVPNQV